MKNISDWKLEEPEPKKLKGTLRLAVIVDPMASSISTTEEEIQTIVDQLEDATGINMKLVASGQGAQVIKGKKIDVVVIDYGGMSFGSGDTVKAQVDYVYHWAEDNPSSLMIIWTPFTANFYQEVVDEFGELNNAFVADGFEADLRAGEKIKEWFPEVGKS